MADDQPLPDLMDYATPNELAMQRLYARSLLAKGQEPITTPAVSPFSIAGGMLNTLAGQNILNRTAQQDRMRQVGSVAGAPIAGGEEDNTPAFGGGGPLSMRPPVGGTAGGDPLVENVLKPTVKKLEGNLTYSQLGPPVQRLDRATGQITINHAIGPYGIMDFNVPSWTKEVLGTAMTPEQFRANPAAQEQVATAKLGQYKQQYGVQGAGQAWLGGPGNANNPNAVDRVTGMTTGRYGDALSHAVASNATELPTGALPSGGGIAPPAMAGSPQAPAGPAGGMLTQPPPKPQMVAGGPQGQVVGTQAGPVAAQGGQPIGPVPLIPRVSRKQYLTGQMLGSPENQALWSSMYYGQNQPIQAQGFGGHWVMDPRGQQPPRFIPDIQKMPVSAGGANAEVPYIFNEQGNMAQPGMGAPAQGQPPAGPLSTTPPPASGAPPRPPVAPQPVPGAPQGPVPGPSGAVQSAMPKLAALETGGNTMTDAGPLGANPPPSATGAVPVPPIAKPEAVPGSARTAQGFALPQFATDAINQLGTLGAQQAAKTEQAKSDVENYNKDYAQFQQMGLNAINNRQQVELAQHIIHDPHFTQGPGTPIKLAWEQLKAFGGDQAAQTNLAYNTAFDKIISGGILRDMKTLLGGWAGQVRNAEINLMNKAAASSHNTIGANQAILDIAQKSQQQLEDIGKLTNLYRQGYQFDNKGEPVVGADGNYVRTGGMPNSAGQNDIIRSYLTSHPLLDPHTIEHYNDVLDQAEKGGGGVATGPLTKAPPGTTPPPGAAAGPSLEDLQREKARRQQQQK